MQICQKTIAEKCGVSAATISRAFTGSANVRPDTMQKIHNAIRALGVTNYDDIFFGKNPLSKHVLVIAGDISNHFYINVVKGIAKALAPEGFFPVLCNSNYDSATEISYMKKIAANGYAGIIMITAVENPELISLLRDLKIPVVMVNRHIRAMDLDIVRIDNYRGGYIAAQYLIENGHSRVAYLSGPRDSAANQDRQRGFTDAMRDYGLVLSKDDIVYGNLSSDCGKRFAAWLCDRGPRYTAAFIANDYMTSGAVNQLVKMGVKVPEAMSVICFDDSPLVNEDNLDITAVSFDPVYMGAAAANLLLQRLGDMLGNRSQLIFPPRLTERSSVRKMA